MPFPKIPWKIPEYMYFVGSIKGKVWRYQREVISVYLDYWSLAYQWFFLYVPPLPLSFWNITVLWSSQIVITPICVIFSRRLHCCNLIWSLANNNYSLFILQFLTFSGNLRLCYIFIPYCNQNVVCLQKTNTNSFILSRAYINNKQNL
jgi:hypothetical protein